MRLLTEAASRQDAIGTNLVSPGTTLPARELLAEMLLEQGKTGEALTAFEATLKAFPWSLQRHVRRFYRRHGAGVGKRAPEHQDEVSASFSADATLVVTASDPARAELSSHYAVDHFGEQSATTRERGGRSNATGTGADVCRERSSGSKPGVGELAREWRLVGQKGRMNRFPRSCDSAP